MNRDIDNDEEVEVNKKHISSIRSYTSKNMFPSDYKSGIYVDIRNETVILPIFKTNVPFHISLIKNISKNEELPFSILRINFITPIAGSNIDFKNYSNSNQQVFIRDLSYKSRDHKNYANLFKTIKDLIKKVKAKDLEAIEKSDLVAQENLVILKGRKIFLNDLTIRPNITGKKTVGVLEAHTNGFRFMSNKGEKVDIIYKNIKHALFQPCENELIVLIHFHLKNPILIGRKKTHDVQFYREAGAQTDDLEIRRGVNEYDEYEIELKEQQLREKINNEFLKFTENAQTISHIDFDIPYRDLAFTGVPHKSNVTLIPTVNCLVSLIELPFFVVTLDEVDLVYFERVSVINVFNFSIL